MSTTVSPTVQLPDGYVANERIGSGGYGEVWRATAPGGVEKAVKIVFGHCGEELAERELKSLERVRSVRHPFVISLERFEVVDGRLIIVTELADMSLDACFRKHQEAGERGIPRAELLGYLNDAADALDCLVQRHSLQHLDIKPENLLVVGGHVKIGDFGLVKELATRTINSMMGGMTPLYSAPEVFDDSPSPHSDQYSLAIVYQQMLTGQLPFPGRTPAQLAKQHTQAEPNIHALSESDQPIVRKALAKQPTERFASCREFVTALTAGGVPSARARAALSGSDVDKGEPDSEVDTKPNASLRTQPISNAPRPVETPDWSGGDSAVASDESSDELFYPQLNEEVVDVSLPDVDLTNAVTVPTLVIGVGGLGIKILNTTHHRLAECGHLDSSCQNLTWLAIDTDRAVLKSGDRADSADRLGADDILHIPLKRPKEYGEKSRQLLNWVSRRWLYNIPRSLETRGYRPLGRIAAVDHADSILSKLYSKLYQLVEANPTTKELRIVVLAGTSGGTGSGIFIDIGQAIRSLANDLGMSLNVQAMLAMPERAAGTAESLSVANTYSLLTELTHAQRFGNVGTNAPAGPAARYDSRSAPFDTVYWLPIPPRNLTDQHAQAFQSIAEFLTVENTVPEAAAAINVCRQLGWKEDFRLFSYSCLPLNDVNSPERILGKHEFSVMGCGFNRVSLLVAPPSSNVIEKTKELLPSLSVCDAQNSRAVLIQAAVGLSPLSVAARLAEFYPDIAEAADRLHTRDDISWHELCRSSQRAGAVSIDPVERDISSATNQPTLKKVLGK